ncbi:MAG: Rieske 2Fe-2S domain-containing protein [Calditrichaeota bacterium]|nr:Rieske 2Fe-2S domain-containing protein [Calditrichota bacterium]
MSILSRRKFLNFSLISSLGSLAAVIFYPIIRFLMPPKTPQAAQTEVVAAKVGELQLDSGKIFKFGNEPGILILQEDGTYKAFTAICTHLGCIVQYRADLNIIWCGCHNGKYDLFGKVISGPPPLPLTEYNVTVINDNIVVSKKA